MKSPSLNKIGGMGLGEVAIAAGEPQRKPSDIRAAMAVLEKEISILNETISQLEDGLGPVLNDLPTATADKKEQRDTYFTQLARMIDEQAALVAAAGFHLSRLHSRLGL